MERPTPNQTLIEIVAALHGDEHSLRKLFDRYFPRLVAVAIATGAYRGANDVAQSALINIWQAIRDHKVEVTSVEQLRAWIHSIGRNAALDYLRKEGRQMRHVDSVLAGIGEQGAIDRIAGNEPTPSQLAQAREKASELRRRHEAREEVVARLRRQDQMLGRMRERDGMTFGAIAAELGAILDVALTEDQMRVRYSRLCANEIGPPAPSVP